MKKLSKIVAVIAALALAAALTGAKLNTQPEQTPMMEARHKILNELIATDGVNQVTVDIIRLSDAYKQGGDAAPGWTNRMTAAHDIADMARKLGVQEDDPIITTLQAIWQQDYNDLQMIAKAISREAPYCPYWHQVAVGAVILNRVADPRFPDNVYDVLAAPLQYSPSYTHDFTGISDEHYQAAIDAMDGNHDVPANVVYQAEFFQGSGIWETSPVWTPYYSSVTYFCY